MKKILNILSKIVIIDYLFFVTIFVFLSKSGSDKIIQTERKITNTSPSPKANPKIGQTGQEEILQNDVPTPTPEPDLFSQVPSHNTISSCWIILESHIYDVTSYFGSHPGGDATLARYCGMDGTSAFNSKDKSPPQEHSAAAKGLLQQYLIK